MRTIVRVCMLGFGLLSFHFALTQQVAKTISSSSSPEGLIGFLQFTPSDYGSQKHPLIIFLHGIGERGNGTSQINSVATNGTPNYCAHGATMRFTVNGQTSSFVVLSPQLSTQYGYWPTFYVKEMIAYAKANLQIDPNRIYVTGLSLGGGGVWRLITDTYNFDHTYDANIAAVAPVCGTQEENDADFCSTIGANHLPVWAFHSMDDGTVNVGATQHAEILGNICGNFSPAMKFTYYQSGGHGGAWINAYDTGHITRSVLKSPGGGNGNGNGNYVNFTASPNLYEWFLTNTRGATPPPTYTAPVANAGAGQSITLPANTITLSGSGAGTNGASISSYSWTKASGPNSGNIVNPGSASTDVGGLSQGTYVFSLTVTDNHGLSSTSSVTVNVNAAAVAAAPPTAAPAPAPSTAPLGYLKQSVGIYQACDDASSSGRIPVYGGGVSNGNKFYLDPQLTQIYNGGYNWFSFTPTLGGTVTQALSVFPDGVIHMVNNCAGAATPAPTPPAATPPPPANSNLLGYLKQSVGIYQACDDASSSGRIPVYGNGLANGNALYLDPQLTQIYNGGYNWFSVTPTLGGAVTQALSVFPDGTVHMLNNCAGATTPAPAPAPAPAPPPPANTNLLGYVKLSWGPYQACDDASSDGRMAVYGTNIANGSYLYTDAAMTQKFDGGWNWYSFTPVLGGSVSYAFAVYPIGSIGLLRTCNNGARVITTAPAANATATVELNTPISIAGIEGKLNMYPNPVRSIATIELNSLQAGAKTINVYSANGVLAAKYTWQTIKGNNTFSLKNVSALPGGLYIADIRDSNGKPVGKLKFVKQ